MNGDLKQTSLFADNAVFLEEIYQIYLKNPNNVDESWRKFFHDFHESNNIQQIKTIAKVVSQTQDVVVDQVIGNQNSQTDNNISTNILAIVVEAIMDAYRTRGHYLVKLDPLEMEQVKTKSELQLNIQDFGLTEDDGLTAHIKLNKQFCNLSHVGINQLVKLLDNVYCTNIGLEVAHITNLQEKQWLFDKVEDAYLHYSLSSAEKRAHLKSLLEVEWFEQYLHVKFPGAKRFSIEGGDSSIVALDYVVNIASGCAISEIIIGMAHRGRLGTLVKVLGKPYKAIFSEFMGNSPFPDSLGISGDVKYHMGYSTDRISNGNKLHLSLASNPSHLEAVNPVVAGKVRAKQDLNPKVENKQILGILIHGDAAFCGQGIVAECLNMSMLQPYSVCGIIHFVVNNQLGFTANSCDTRSSRYATDIAKAINAPIFHVNGDDIESVLRATYLAFHYRDTFQRDVVIEIVCYRKYGHNEGDEPLYTQSPMYNVIKNKKSPATIYADSLIACGVVDDAYLRKLQQDFKTMLDSEHESAKSFSAENHAMQGLWSGYTRVDSTQVMTGVDIKLLQKLGTKLCTIPADFVINPKIAKLLEHRMTSLQSASSIDWATAEQLAFASLLIEGTNIRLTGQDSGRGTFSHRHSVLHSQVSNDRYIPLNNLESNQGKYFVADSNLSEYGVLGFEYGYSLVQPKNLVLWEGQFGDFANGAQIIFDQFISSGEQKWMQLSGLVVLLPHGSEGQGPEHSSGRLERFLSLAAEDNMQVTYPTTPASFFHLLRRQIHSKVRKPLIVMTPKSLLRHKLAVSALADIGKDKCFVPIIDELENFIECSKAKRVIVCTGKIYYDLVEMRMAKNIKDIAIIRLEQLYPFAIDVMTNILRKYNNVSEFVWCQEEPQNMGAWSFISTYLNDILGKIECPKRFMYIGKPSAASPAVGQLYLHNKQQEAVLKNALNIE